MNPQMLEQLASQRNADLRAAAAQRQRAAEAPVNQHSFRERTGWTLIHLGLRLAVQPGQQSAIRPRPARS